MLFDISLRKLFAHMVYVAMSIVYNVSAISYTVGVILFGPLVSIENILPAVLQLLLIILLIIRQSMEGLTTCVSNIIMAMPSGAILPNRRTQ